MKAGQLGLQRSGLNALLFEERFCRLVLRDQRLHLCPRQRFSALPAPAARAQAVGRGAAHLPPDLCDFTAEGRVAAAAWRPELALQRSHAPLEQPDRPGLLGGLGAQSGVLVAQGGGLAPEHRQYRRRVGRGGRRHRIDIACGTCCRSVHPCASTHGGEHLQTVPRSTLRAYAFSVELLWPVVRATSTTAVTMRAPRWPRGWARWAPRCRRACACCSSETDLATSTATWQYIFLHCMIPLQHRE